MIYDLQLPYKVPPLNMNDRHHWSLKATWNRQIKDDTFFLAAAARLPKGVAFAHITLVYNPPDKRRRDDSNYSASLKPAVDGLVRYGLVEDDDSTHVKSDCAIGALRKPGEVHLRIEVAE